MESRVDVVIVHYRTPATLRSCLEAVHRVASELLGRVVVVDNASPGRAVEETAAAYPRVEWLRNPRNLGFAAGCNRGIAVGGAAHCLLLNPDTRIESPAIEALVGCMIAHPDAGVVAPRLVNPDGSLQWSCRRYPTLAAVLVRGARLEALIPGPVDDYLMRDWDHAEVREVDWAIGACLLLRRAALEEVGMLDEKFFLYYEDTDLCRRMRLAGWKVLYEPAAVVPHEHRRESARFVPSRAQVAHLGSLARIFRKHRFALW
jgi:GT2 family glycosyltransferase